MPVGIGFDIDHTLLIDNKLERIAFLRLLERTVARGGQYLGSLNDETQRIDALLAQQRAGACSIEDAVASFVRDRGVQPNDDDVTWYKRIALALSDDILVPLPGAIATLQALSERGVKTAILTNGWNPLQLRKAQRVVFEGPVLASADIGVQKPDPRAFEALAAVLELPNDRVWYVGDDPVTDIAGALEVGMSAIWLNVDGKPYPSGTLRPARVIHAMEELLLPQW